MNNVPLLLRSLKLDSSKVKFAGPYQQRRNSKTLNGCQIDILIETEDHQIFVCELKTGKLIRRDVVRAINDKVKKLKRPKYKSLRTVLVTSSELEDSPYFEEHLDFIVDPLRWVV